MNTAVFDLRIGVDENSNIVHIADITVPGVVRRLDLPSLEWGSALLDMIAGVVGKHEIAELLFKYKELEKRVNTLEAGQHARWVR